MDIYLADVAQDSQLVGVHRNFDCSSVNPVGFRRNRSIRNYFSTEPTASITSDHVRTTMKTYSIVQFSCNKNKGIQSPWYYTTEIKNSIIDGVIAVTNSQQWRRRNKKHNKEECRRKVGNEELQR